MHFNRKGKNQADDESSRNDISSQYSDYNTNNIRIGGNQLLGRSPISNNTRRQDLDKSHHESGPEIMYIDPNQNDRRNPMMNYSDANSIGFTNSRSPIHNELDQLNYRNSVLANVKKEVGNNRDGNFIANSSIPINFDLDRERSNKVIKLDDQYSNYSNNTRNYNQRTNNSRNNMNQTLNKDTGKSQNTSYISDNNNQRRNINVTTNPGNNGIIKKMSPNRNNDMSIDVVSGKKPNQMKYIKKLSIIADKQNPNYNNRVSIKPEYSVDTRDNINSKYTTDLDKIIKYNQKHENFKKFSANVVASNPKEGRLYTTRTHTISPEVHSHLQEQKEAIKNMNKLSTILIKEAKTSKEGYGTNTNKGTIRNSSNDYEERTLRKNANDPNAGKSIRTTMSLISSKGPNCEDRILTRQMRFEKGGVVDLAQSTAVNNRSAPKKILEIKKTNLRASPRPNRNNSPRYGNKEKESAAKILQAWWRDILGKYKDVVKKTITLQKFWRRYFVRKNLYYKLSYYFYYTILFGKIEKLIRRHNLMLGFEPLYNLNAEKYNAIKYLRNVIFIQRAFRFYRNLKKYQLNKSKDKFNLKKPIKIPNVRAYVNQNTNQSKDNKRYENDDNEQNEADSTANVRVNTIGKSQNVKDNFSSNKEYEEKERVLIQKLNNFRDKFMKSVVQNILNRRTSFDLRSYANKWRSNCSNSKTAERVLSGRNMATTVFYKVMLKSRFSTFISNLRKAGEKPDKSLKVNKLVYTLLPLFNAMKRTAFVSLKKNIPSIKNNITPELFYKNYALLLKSVAGHLLRNRLKKRFSTWVQRVNDTKKKDNAPKLVKSTDVNANPNNTSEDSESLNISNKKNVSKVLRRLIVHLESNFKNKKLPYFFYNWKQHNTKDNLKSTIIKKLIASFDKIVRVRSLSKKFILWATKARENRTVEKQVLISQDKNTRLTATSKLVPALTDYLRKKIAKKYSKNLLSLINQKNKISALKKILKFKPFCQKYNLQKYFDKFKNSGTVTEKDKLARLLLKTNLRNLLRKSKNEILRKKLNQWWRNLPSTNNDNMKGFYAVERLKQALQKRYFQHPKEALREKIENGNFDWSLKFIIEIKKKFLQKSVKEYVIRWRNNYYRDEINSTLKNFYAKLMLSFAKRYSKRILGKSFKTWKTQKDKMNEILDNKKKDEKKKNGLVSAKRFKDLFSSRMKVYFDDLTKKLCYKKKITKHQIALKILVDLCLFRELRDLGRCFRNWNKKTVMGELSKLKANLISRILFGLLKKHDGLKNIGKIYLRFTQWKNFTTKDIETINNLNGLIKRFLLSSVFRYELITKNIDDLHEIAVHYNGLRKKQALKIGDFMSAVLKIYKRIDIMKRQKALHESLSRMNFFEKMQIFTACKRWIKKTAIISNDEKATILQDFIRKLYQYKNDKANLYEKANVSLDNFTKRFIFFKMSEAAKLNKLVSIVVKLMGYVPQELRKNYLRKFCIDWRETAKSIKHNNASNRIIALLKGYIARKFLYKIKLRKHYMTEIIRRGLKRFFSEKFYYMTEWARNAKMLSLKYNAMAIALWIPNKFKAYKKLWAYRILAELFQKKRHNYYIGTLNKFAKTNKLINVINKATFHKNAIPFWKGLKLKYFRKKFSTIFADITYNLRFYSVNYYVEKWRKRVSDIINYYISKIQRRAIMMILRLRKRREIRRNNLITRLIVNICSDAKITKQGYINIWRNLIKYIDIDKKIDVINRIVIFINDKKDAEKEIAMMNLKKLFTRYIVSNIKFTLIDCRNYKDSVVDVLKNLDSKLEKRYALNNLVDFGKDTLRNSIIHIITNKVDILSRNMLIRLAIEKWRTDNAILIKFVLKLQSLYRGHKLRNFLKRAQRIYDLLIMSLTKYLDDKQLIKVRLGQWANKIRYNQNQEKAKIIQKFLRSHLDGIMLKRLQILFNEGFRRHFIFCIKQVSRYNKLKNSLTKPINNDAMYHIKRRFIFLRIRDMLVELMGNATEENKKLHKEQIMKKWRIQLAKIKENEKFAALLIVASIKAKLMKLRIKKWQELSLKIKAIIYMAFGGNEGIKRCIVLQWLYNSKKLALIQSRQALGNHAKSILSKIKSSDHNSRQNTIKDGLDIVIKTIKKNIFKMLYRKLFKKNKKIMLIRIDDIYRKTYINNERDAFKRINLYGIYRENLIKKIQRHWRVYYKLYNFIRKITMMKTVIKYATNKELATKHAYTLLWRLHIQNMNNRKHSNTLQRFYRDILAHQRKKKINVEDRLKKMIRKYGIKNNNILDGLRLFKTLWVLKNINNIIVRSHFNYFKFKSMILYILYILHGQFNKVEAKVKSTCVYKFRRIALILRDREAASKVLRCLTEVKRRRHDNKIRDILVRIAFGRTLDENEIKLRVASQWCREAYILKTKEKVKIIDEFLTKKKRSFDLIKKWQRFGLRKQALNGVITANLLLKQIKLFRKTHPFVKFITRHNIALNGVHLLKNLRRMIVFNYIKNALKNSCGILDDETIRLHAKHWRLNVWKLQQREKALSNAGKTLRLKFLERGFRAVIGAYDFERYSGLARIVLIHDAMKRMKLKAQGMTNIRKFTNILVEAQQFHINMGSLTFKDKLYKFYVFKILANFASLITKVRDTEYKQSFFRVFLDNIKDISGNKSISKFTDKVKIQRGPKTIKTQVTHTQLTASQKEEIELFGKDKKSKFGKILPIFVSLVKRLSHKRKKDFIKHVTTMGGLGKLKLIFRLRTKYVFDVLKKMKSQAIARATLYTLLRRVYLSKKLEEIASTNKFLIVCHLLKLAGLTKSKLDSRFKLKLFRVWKYNAFSLKIRDNKLKILEQTIDKFSSNIKSELFEGDESILKQFKSFNTSNKLFDFPLGMKNSLEGKPTVSKLKQKTANYIQKQNTIQKRDSMLIPENDGEEMYYNPRDTLISGKNAKTKFDRGK